MSSVDVSWALGCVLFFFFKQKTAYDMRISDWSSDVCSSDLLVIFEDRHQRPPHGKARAVQRMDELVALHILAAEARVHAARLAIAAVRAARNLAVAVLPRQPDFAVICLARGQDHVAAAEQPFPVGPFACPGDFLGWP